MKLSITFRRDKNIAARAAARVWLLFKPDRERRKALAKKDIRIDLFTARNITVLSLVFAWAALYFSYQYVFVETPRYYYGTLFTVAPTLFLQQFRHWALDHFSAYFYVYGMGLLYLIFWGVAFASERKMWKLALGFLVCWVAQGTLQLALGVASPIRVPGNGVIPIREQVFPLSEAMMGIKYGAIPSGHIGAPVILFLTGWVRKIKWVQWLGVAFFAAFWFIVLYLGEHYVIDGVVSIFLYTSLFLGAWTLATRFERWRAKGTGVS